MFTDNNTKIKFILNSRKIRVNIDGTPGFGGQYNTILILRNIINMGFRGAVEFVCRDAALYKLYSLLGIDKTKRVTNHDIWYEYRGIQVTIYSYSYFMTHKFNFETLDAGLSGGQLNFDHTHHATLFKVRQYLLIPPFGTMNPIVISSEDRHSDLVIEEDVNISTGIDNPGTTFTEVQQALTHVKDPIRRANLAEIIDAQAQGQIIIQSIYGLHYRVVHMNFPRELTLINLIMAARYYQLMENIEEPMVLVVQHELTDDELYNIRQVINKGRWPFSKEIPYYKDILAARKQLLFHEKFRICNVDSKQDSVKATPAQSVVLLPTGSLQSEISEYFTVNPFKSLPPFIEGPNSGNLLLAKGVPFIQSFYVLYDLRPKQEWELNYRLLDENLANEIKLVSTASLPHVGVQDRLWRDKYQLSPPRRMAEYYKNTANSDSPLSQAFRVLGQNHRGHDKFNQAITQLPDSIGRVVAPPLATSTFHYFGGTSHFSQMIIEGRFVEALKIQYSSVYPLPHIVNIKNIPSRWGFLSIDDPVSSVDYQTGEQVTSSVTYTKKLLSLFEEYSIVAKLKSVSNLANAKLILAFAFAYGDINTAKTILSANPVLAMEKLTIREDNNQCSIRLCVVALTNYSQNQAFITEYFGPDIQLTSPEIEYVISELDILTYQTFIEPYADVTQVIKAAVKASNLQLVDYLLDNNDFEDEFLQKLLTTSVSHHRFEHAELILDYVDEIHDSSILTVLVELPEQADLLEKCLNKGADADFRPNENSDSLLTLATSQEVVVLLIRYQSDDEFYWNRRVVRIADYCRETGLWVNTISQHDLHAQQVGTSLPLDQQLQPLTSSQKGQDVKHSFPRFRFFAITANIQSSTPSRDRKCYLNLAQTTTKSMESTAARQIDSPTAFPKSTTSSPTTIKVSHEARPCYYPPNSFRRYIMGESTNIVDASPEVTDSSALLELCDHSPYLHLEEMINSLELMGDFKQGFKDGLFYGFIGKFIENVLAEFLEEDSAKFIASVVKNMIKIFDSANCWFSFMLMSGGKFLKSCLNTDDSYLSTLIDKVIDMGMIFIACDPANPVTYIKASVTFLSNYFGDSCGEKLAIALHKGLKTLTEVINRYIQSNMLSSMAEATQHNFS